MSKKIIYKELSFKIVGILFDVYNELGYGYQEKIYERAVEKLFIKEALKYERQPCYKLQIQGENIGRYYLDFLVDDKIILELKKGNYFSRKNIEQVYAYLKATDKKLAILANFTSKGIACKRIVNIT